MPNELLKSAARAIFDVIAEKQFKDLQRNQYYYSMMLINTPMGKEKQEFKVGDSVISSGTGTYKKGFAMIVTEAYEENGFWKYVCGHGAGKRGKCKFQCTERQKDLAIYKNE